MVEEGGMRKYMSEIALTITALIWEAGLWPVPYRLSITPHTDFQEDF